MVWHWFRKPAGAIPYRFKSCTLRFKYNLDLLGIYVIFSIETWAACSGRYKRNLKGGNR